MSTLTFTGTAIAINKVIRITKGSSAVFSTNQVIKLGLGLNLVAMNGWSPSEFVDAWSALTTDPYSDITVTTDEDETYLEFTHGTAGEDFEITSLIDEVALSVSNEVQTLTILRATGGTFTLTFDGQTTSGIAYNANAATIQSALEALSNLAPGDVTVAGTGPFTITFGGAYLGLNVPLITSSASSLTGSSASASVSTVRNYSLGASFVCSIQFNVTQTVSPLNEIQTFKINNNPTSGTFTLTYSGQTTSAIAYNASLATITAALEALSNIAPGDVLLTGGPLPQRTVTIEFKGALAATDVGQLTSDASSLGSTTSNLDVVLSQAGANFTTKPRWVFNTTSMSSGSDWRIAFTTTDGSGNFISFNTDTLAYNANAATIKAALAAEGDFKVLAPALTLTSSMRQQLFDESEITITNAFGNSAFTIELSESAYYRLLGIMVNGTVAGSIIKTSPATTISGTYTAPTGTPVTEQQTLVATGPIPSAGSFNLDYGGTNTDAIDLSDPNRFVILDDELNEALPNTNAINQPKWVWYNSVVGIYPPNWITTAGPFEAADFDIFLPDGSAIHLLRPFARSNADTLDTAYINQSDPNWKTTVADNWNATIEAYELSQNNLLSASATYVSGVPSTPVLIAFNPLAPGSYGPKTLLVVEDSGATATITHATTVVGGTTVISGITGGTFTLTLTTPTTTYNIPSIPYDASNALLTSMINDYFGSNVVTVTNGPLPLTAATLTFSGILANLAITASILPSFYGSAIAGSLTPTVLQEGRPSTERSNTWRLTVAPGSSSLVGPNGRIVLTCTTISPSNSTGKQEVSIPLSGLSCEAIEEAFTELFGQRVIHVVQVEHSLQHRTAVVSPYTGAAVNHHFWFYQDAYEITWLEPYELESLVPSFVLTSVPAFTTLFPTPTLDDNDNDTNDVLTESYKVWLGFKTLNDAGTPAHIISLTFAGTQAANTLIYNYVTEPQYSDSLTASRVGLANMYTNRKVRFVWCGVNETTTSGSAQPVKSFTPLAYSIPMDWDSGIETIKYNLERMVIALTNAPQSEPMPDIEYLDDNDIAYTPVFCGIGNVEVAGSLDSVLVVTFKGKLDRANFNHYPYELRCEFIADIYPWNTPTTDPSQLDPRIYSFISGKVFNPAKNTIVRYTLDSATAPLYVSYNGQSTTLTSTMTRREIQTAINSLSTLPRLVPSLPLATTSPLFNQDLDLNLGTSDRFWTAAASYPSELVRPAAANLIIPHKLGRAVTVSGSIPAKSLTLEMSGAGLQFSPTIVGVGNDAPESLFTLTVVTEGVASGAEVQRVSITPISTNSPAPTSGTFKLNNGSSDTSTIAYNATASEVAAAVTALGSTYACSGSGGPLPSTPVTLTFSGSSNLAQLTVTNSTLKNCTTSVTLTTEGGYEGSLVYSETTPGYGPAFFHAPDNWTPVQAPSSGDTLVLDTLGESIKFSLRQSYSFTNIGSNRILLSPRRVAFIEGQKVHVSSSSALPTGLTAGYYYVRNPTSDCTLQLSSTPTGSLATITGLGSGTHTIQLRELTIEWMARSAVTTLGLDFNRSNLIKEHLCPYLKAGFTSIEIGIGSGGDGPVQAKFDTLNINTPITIHKTSSSNEPDVPAVCILANNGSTAITIDQGELGMGIQTGETNLLSTIVATNSTLQLRNTTINDDLDATDSEVSLYRVAVGSYVNN